MPHPAHRHRGAGPDTAAVKCPTRRLSSATLRLSSARHGGCQVPDTAAVRCHVYRRIALPHGDERSSDEQLPDTAAARHGGCQCPTRRYHMATNGVEVSNCPTRRLSMPDTALPHGDERSRGEQPRTREVMKAISCFHSPSHVPEGAHAPRGVRGAAIVQRRSTQIGVRARELPGRQAAQVERGLI